MYCGETLRTTNTIEDEIKRVKIDLLRRLTENMNGKQKKI